MGGHTTFLGPTAPLVIGFVKGKISIVRGVRAPASNVPPVPPSNLWIRMRHQNAGTKQLGSNGNCLGLSFCCIEI
jgi:hypothetical protein